MALEVRRLGIWEEGVSVLNNLEIKDGIIFAKLNKMILALPLEMEQKMRSNIGKRISILRTDIPGRQFLIRVIPDQENNEGGA